ncbi:hypothetical protein NDU88_007031 [Pleurodeles waltl]|uniref:Uncharacterized protein n=1 Tax=Pleurodeles waltl TaxID=8319 RepID=A0AAV7LYM5_PLEWA|nr:hypothetical protein NDU88_007031 [Pleurodeles waltl]
MPGLNIPWVSPSQDVPLELTQPACALCQRGPLEWATEGSLGPALSRAVLTCIGRKPRRLAGHPRATKPRREITQDRREQPWAETPAFHGHKGTGAANLPLKRRTASFVRLTVVPGPSPRRRQQGTSAKPRSTAVAGFQPLEAGD